MPNLIRLAISVGLFLIGSIDLKSQDSLLVRGTVFSTGTYRGGYYVGYSSSPLETQTGAQSYFEFHIPIVDFGDSLDLYITCADSMLGSTQIHRVPARSDVYHVLAVNFTQPLQKKPDSARTYWGSDIGLTAEFYEVSFQNFNSSLGPENTSLLDSVNPMILLDFNGFIKRWYFGVGYGQRLLERNDSLSRELRHRIYRLRGGYQLIQSRKVRITSITGLRWMRWRLLNAPATSAVPLSQYLDDRELDLRFTQWVWEAGLKVGFVFANIPSTPDLYLGFSVSYAAPLHRQPIVRSASYRLEDNTLLHVPPWLIGINIAIFIDSNN